MLNLVLAQREACFEWRTWDSQAFFACARYRVATLQTSHSYGVFCRVSFGGCSAFASIQVPWLVTNTHDAEGGEEEHQEGGQEAEGHQEGEEGHEEEGLAEEVNVDSLNLRGSIPTGASRRHRRCIHPSLPRPDPHHSVPRSTLRVQRFPRSAPLTACPDPHLAPAPVRTTWRLPRSTQPRSAAFFFWRVEDQLQSALAGAIRAFRTIENETLCAMPAFDGQSGKGWALADTQLRFQ